MKGFLLLVSVAGILGCASVGEQTEKMSSSSEESCASGSGYLGDFSDLVRLKSYLVGVDFFNPQTDAEKRYAIGDTRFLMMVTPKGIVVPGLGSGIRPLLCEYGGETIAFESHLLLSDDHYELLGKVKDYAAKFNRRMKKLVTANEG